jgi:hypothetical protein
VEHVEKLRIELEKRLNALQERGKYSFFVEIAAEVCSDLNDYGVIGHSSYVPD